ncbi:hypothetical protein AAMO2058_000546200 [Amorphochlora amoebiformis]
MTMKHGGDTSVDSGSDDRDRRERRRRSRFDDRDEKKRQVRAFKMRIQTPQECTPTGFECLEDLKTIVDLVAKEMEETEGKSSLSYPPPSFNKTLNKI